MKEAHRQLYPSQRMEGHTKKKIIKGLWKFTQGRYHFQRERESSEMFYRSSEDHVRLPRD